MVAFLRQLAGGVNAELAAETGRGRGHIKVVNGAVGQDQVGGGVEVVGNAPGHFGGVLHVNEMVNHHDDFGQA